MDSNSNGRRIRIVTLKWDFRLRTGKKIRTIEMYRVVILSLLLSLQNYEISILSIYWILQYYMLVDQNLFHHEVLIKTAIWVCFPVCYTSSNQTNGPAVLVTPLRKRRWGFWSWIVNSWRRHILFPDFEAGTVGSTRNPGLSKMLRLHERSSEKEHGTKHMRSCRSCRSDVCGMD